MRTVEQVITPPLRSKPVMCQGAIKIERGHNGRGGVNDDAVGHQASGDYLS